MFCPLAVGCKIGDVFSVPGKRDHIQIILMLGPIVLLWIPGLCANTECLTPGSSRWTLISDHVVCHHHHIISEVF